MKASNQFILRTIADENLLIPVGEAALSVKGLIALSESGALLFQTLKKSCEKADLISALMAEYDVSEKIASQDVEAFLGQMRQLGMLVED